LGGFLNLQIIQLYQDLAKFVHQKMEIPSTPNSEELKNDEGRDSTLGSPGRPLEKVFKLMDKDRSGIIDGVDLIFSILNEGYRFRNKEVYYILKGYPRVIDRKINFDNVKQIFAYLDLSEQELENFTVTPIEAKRVDLRILGMDFGTHDLAKLGISQTKKRDLESLFIDTLSMKDEKNSYKGLITFIKENLKNVISEDQIQHIMSELEIGIEALTINTLRICWTTKAGCITLINLRRIMKVMKQELPISSLEIIKDADYVTKNFKKSALLNMGEAYELLDLQGKGCIDLPFIQKHHNMLSKNLNPEETKILALVMSPDPTKELSFGEFIRLFTGQLKKKNVAMKDIRSFAKQIGKKIFIK
jgi:Ca2+-binding EF-hand superfamily protein